jgi:hypothetical protein
VGNNLAEVDIGFDGIITKSHIAESTLEDRSVFVEELLDLVPLTNDDEGQGTSTAVLLNLSNSE